MHTILTQKSFVFRNDETGDICAVPRSNTITSAKKVPDWVLHTSLFKLALKDKSVTVIDVKTEEDFPEAEPAKVENPYARQIGVAEALEDVTTETLTGQVEFARG